MLGPCYVLLDVTYCVLASVMHSFHGMCLDKLSLFQSYESLLLESVHVSSSVSF